MASAKAKHKSKPAKKPAGKTFHKQAVGKPKAPRQEDTPNTAQVANETVIPPTITPTTEVKPEPEPEAVPTGQDPHPLEENNTIASQTSTPQETDAIETTPTGPDEPTPTPEEPLPSSTTIEQEENKSKKPIILAAIVVGTMLLLTGGYFLYSKKQNTKNLQALPTLAAQSPQPSTDTTPQTLNQLDWTLEILNGSAKTGAASALAEKLTAKGYQIIKIGNNPQDVDTTQVFFSDSIKDKADLFLEDIADGLPTAENSGSLTDSTASARIIIGAD